MPKDTKIHTCVASKWRLCMLLLLAFLTSGLALAKTAQAHPSDGTSTSRPPIIGISIGNSYSSVGVRYAKDDAIHIIPRRNGTHESFTIPSVVAFTDTGEALVGDDAVHVLLSHPKRSVTGFKRLLGRTLDEVQDFVKEAHYKLVERNDVVAVEIPFRSGSQIYYPKEIAALVMKQLKTMAEEYIGEEIKETTINVPASFNDRQRAAVREAGSIAGLDVLRIINEPTASGVGYYLDIAPGQSWPSENKVLTYNLDGTAFEANVVDIEEGVFEILSAVRSENISKNSLDVDLSHQTYLRYVTQDPHNNEGVKRSLLDDKDGQNPLASVDSGIDKTTATEKLGFTNSFDVSQALKIVDQAIRDANVTIYDITDIVPFGDPLYDSRLETLIRKRFPSTVPFHNHIDPKLTTTHGAARQGSLLYDYGCTTCGCPVDVSIWALGIETAGGIMTTMVKRGTSIPTKKSILFTTTTDNQTSVLVTVFKGERDFVANNTKVGSLELDGLVPSPAGVPEIEITFTVDPRRGLTVSLTDRGSGKTEALFIDGPQLELDGDWALVEAQIEEYEKYAEVERALRDKIQKQIVQSEDGPRENTSGIIERTLLYRDFDSSGGYGFSWRQWLDSIVHIPSVLIDAMLAYVPWR